MAILKPFRGLRPPAALAARVSSPPYDVVNTAEARALAAEEPLSFLRVTRPEIEFSGPIDLYDDRVYEQGRAKLRQFIEDGVLVRDRAPSFYIYRLVMEGRPQTGVMAAASVAEYQADKIKKHELTRQDKEDDRTRHADVQNANAEPVFLTYRARTGIDALVARLSAAAPDLDVTAPDGVRHTVWVVSDPARVAELAGAFAAVDCSYVADGHHRSAAASRVAELRRRRDPAAGPDSPHEFFLAVFFPHDQLKILDYNRVVRDLNGLSVEQFLAEVGQRFDLAPSDTPRPAGPMEFGLLVGGRWWRLRVRPGRRPDADPVRDLDVSILQDDLLGPVLGILDQRTDKRIDFVGGIRGIAELERRCREDAVAAFLLHPTSIEQLLTIADAGALMPPKSTWFEPKLRSGLVVRLLDE